MSNIKVAIINLNISNVGSISRALRKINYNSIVTNNIKDLENSSHIIFPGVGSFDKGVEKLKEFKEAGKIKIKKFLEDINAVDIKLNGRINPDTILLKTID